MSETNFKHVVSYDWMDARKRFLTASDIRKLIPYTKSGNKRVVSDETKIEVAASKLIDTSMKDCVSFGAAARGHLLEPYAITAYNGNASLSSLALTHIDDQIIFRKDSDVSHRVLPLAFSPDAANIRLPNDEVVINQSILMEPFFIGEVKCYNPGKHLTISTMPKEKIEERWQIATAMAVCKNIYEGVLILYCPDIQSPHQKLFGIKYSRQELDEEIEIVNKIHSDYCKWINDFIITTLNPRSLVCHDKAYEVYSDIANNQQLNP